ncbi:cell wall anchor protein [Rummeliibacillus sp. JY-2-4R]
MKLTSKNLKKASIAAALGMGLSAFGVVAEPGNTASAAQSGQAHAQKLVNSLEALKVDHVDYLYAYLQSISLSNSEYKGIVQNAHQVRNIVGGQNVANLSNEEKAKVLRLFLDSIKLAHLQASFVDDKGNPIDVISYRPGTTGLNIVLKDLKGNVLATIDPTKADLTASALSAKINALVQAVSAKRALDQSSDKFVPMPVGELPDTDANNLEYMLLGGLLIAIGSIALVPATRSIRKNSNIVEV